MSKELMFHFWQDNGDFRQGVPVPKRALKRWGGAASFCVPLEQELIACGYRQTSEGIPNEHNWNLTQAAILFVIAEVIIQKHLGGFDPSLC